MRLVGPQQHTSMKLWKWLSFKISLQIFAMLEHLPLQVIFSMFSMIPLTMKSLIMLT